MAAIDFLFAAGWIRKATWRLWYPFVTRRLKGEEVLFLNYGFEEDPPMVIPLRPEDEPNRCCLQLYHHVASQVPLKEKNVLEVSCGHGGGAAYIARALQPRSYLAIDLNPAAVNWCRQRHVQESLIFERGDSENLRCADGTFDAVVNVEASHCYADFPRFLAETARVLRPGGHLLYADFRFRERFQEWEHALASAPLETLSQRNINEQVLRGITHNSERSRKLIARHLPRFLHSLAGDFAGVEGSRIFNALKTGEISYRSYCLRKPVQGSRRG